MNSPRRELFDIRKWTNVGALGRADHFHNSRHTLLSSRWRHVIFAFIKPMLVNVKAHNVECNLATTRTLQFTPKAKCELCGD